MADLDNEKEQLAAIKKWIQENGLSIVAGIVLGLGGVYGWRYWQEYRVSQSELTSAQLTEVVEHLDKQQYEAGVTIAQDLVEANTDTLYAEMAQLLIARARVQQGLLYAAAEPLQALIKGSASSQFKNVARIRLARIYLAQSKFDLAAALISESADQTYQREFEELRGDIFFYKGELNEARSSYVQALALASPAENTELLQMKLDEIPAAGE